ARVARAPVSAFHLVEEILQQLVEERGLFEIDGVAALRQHSEPRCRYRALEKEVRLERGLLLVAEHEDRGNRHFLQALVQVVERGPAALHAEQSIRGAESAVRGEL